MSLFNKQKDSKILVASLQGQQCRIQLFDRTDSGLIQLAAKQLIFTELEGLSKEFAKTVQDISARGVTCRWMLNVDHYQTHLVEAPKVADTEMREALKWQIKDLLDAPVEDMLISHYRPNHPEQSYNQINAVAVKKSLVESLIAMTKDADLQLDAIEIEELCIGNALVDKLDDKKIVGFVGENSAGLVFSFYNGNELCFTRHKKGRFIPRQPSESEFVLDDEMQTQEDNFLLETQRTLDYVISQIFRRPLDQLLLQKEQARESLTETMGQLTDTQVDWMESQIESSEGCEFLPSLAETGCARRVVG